MPTLIIYHSLIFTFYSVVISHENSIIIYKCHACIWLDVKYRLIWMNEKMYFRQFQRENHWNSNVIFFLLDFTWNSYDTFQAVPELTIQLSNIEDFWIWFKTIKSWNTYFFLLQDRHVRLFLIKPTKYEKINEEEHIKFDEILLS